MGTELFYTVKGKKQDSGIHGEILANSKANKLFRESTRAWVRANTNLTEEEINLLYPENINESKKAL